MDLSFINDRLQGLLEDSSKLAQKYGPENARLICKRLLQLKAAPTLEELPMFTGRHPLEGNRKGQYAIDLKNGWRIIFVPVEPFEEDNRLSIIKIKIVEITNYH